MRQKGTSLAPAFEGIEGSHAVLWGAEDFVSLVKEVTELNEDAEEFEKFEARGGVMDGEQLTPERVKEISKWPSRAEQLSMLLVGQILGSRFDFGSTANWPRWSVGKSDQAGWRRRGPRNKRLGRGYRVRLPNRGVGKSNRGWLVFTGQLVHKSVQFDNEF